MEQGVRGGIYGLSREDVWDWCWVVVQGGGRSVRVSD